MGVTPYLNALNPVGKRVSFYRAPCLFLGFAVRFRLLRVISCLVLAFSVRARAIALVLVVSLPCVFVPVPGPGHGPWSGLRSIRLQREYDTIPIIYM